uniref:glutamate--tRNA ligase n=1 Tax=Globisporangium ultimum (strain ATCC 200006 / CBS 805.95 / DAOM BR144) TaxID=431595 RepID=K3X9E6_GLOUD
MAATEADITARIAAKGEEIRVLKAAKDEAQKDVLAAAIAELLTLKAEFKSVTGKDYGPPPKQPAKKEKKPAAAVQEEDPNKKSKKELNKERKKAQKSALKSGGDAVVDAAAAVPVVAEKAPKTKKAADATPKQKQKETAAPKGPVGRVLPVPATDQDETIVFSSASVLPLASFVIAQFVKHTKAFVNHVKETNIVPTLTFADGNVVSGDFAIARYLARTKLSLGFYGLENDALLASQVDSWLDFALTSASTTRGLELLNVVLKDRTFLVGYALSLADIGVWASLSASKSDVTKYAHVARWFSHLNAQDVFSNAEATLKALKPVVPAASTAGKSKDANSKPNSGNNGASQKGKNTGSCPPLKDAVEGQVVTRFPPEPSGYLHIGHVKACMLNHYYAKHYNGKLIVRFDDTNPSKEKEEFEQSIINDLKRLDIVADEVTYTSDHFPKIIEFARQLIREGNGYMDNTDQETMRAERMDGINSKCRDQDPAVALDLFEKLLNNDPEAAGYCLRGKIDMQAKNKTLRDPVFFRSNPTPHHRTGTKYKAYPTYDFACPIVDSVEGVTHALRTTEYNDRDFQYQWVLQALKLRKVHIQGFARMNFVYSVLSKRKLQWFVDNGHVEGWNDPRFPTVQGVLRRGVQVEALREFILSQGASRRITDMEWDKFWTLNKRVIDPVASRYYALDKNNSVPLLLTNIPEGVVGVPVPRHPKDASLGNKVMRFSNKLLLERDDVNNFVVDEEVTLMRHGNIIIKKVNKDASGNITSVEALDNPTGDFKKTKLKVTWLADVHDLVPVTLVEFDHLLKKPKLEEGDNFVDHLTAVTRAEMVAIGDHELRNAKRGDIVQLERRGYFRVDQPYLSTEKPLVLFMVPDGKSKAMSTLSTNLAHR